MDQSDKLEYIVHQLTENQHRLYGCVYSLLGDHSRTADEVQETNIVLWRKLVEFDAGTPFLPWAFAIVPFQVKAHLRDHKRDRILLDAELARTISGETQRQAEHIDPGLAQIKFFCGATVVVEAPVDLDLRSPLLARVRSGRMRAQMPPAAREFSLEIDDMKVVDPGTEFGLSVSPEGAGVQVFGGEVELQQTTTEIRLLTSCTAVVRSPDGTYSEAEMTPGRFLDIAAFEARAEGHRDEHCERWKTWSEQLRRDRRLITYYAFHQDGDWLRRLKSSLVPGKSELDRAIVGAHRVAGRWASKDGLEFKQPGDRVRVQIQGEFTSLTFTCWVKIDSLDRWDNSLFLTDHYNQGEPHWQILDTGQLFFTVCHQESKWQHRRICNIRRRTLGRRDHGDI